MQRVDGTLVFSPSDLQNFVDCEHLTRLQVRVCDGELIAPSRDDEELDLLRRKGIDHERAWLDTLPSERRDAELLRLWTAKEALYKADPTQGESIVAEYVLASPGDEITTGGRRDSTHHATVTSLRQIGAVLSVAICLPGESS